MLTLSLPISVGHAMEYYKEKFTNKKENYYSQSGEVKGQWCGTLAEEWNLKGEVSSEQYERLTAGQDPHTGEQLIRVVSAREVVDEELVGESAQVEAETGGQLERGGDAGQVRDPLHDRLFHRTGEALVVAWHLRLLLSIGYGTAEVCDRRRRPGVRTCSHENRIDLHHLSGKPSSDGTVCNDGGMG